MDQLPAEKVPKQRTEGAKYRARQLFYQLPRQDFSTKYSKFLKEEEKQSFIDMNNEKVEDALGIGQYECLGINPLAIVVEKPTFLFLQYNLDDLLPMPYKLNLRGNDENGST